MASTFDIVANTWDTPTRVERSQIISKKIIENIQSEYFENTLEFGCGTGLITFNFIDKIKTGLLIDTSENMINVVNQKISISKYKNICGKCIDINNIQMNPNFSFIYSSMVLHHIDNIDKLSKTLYRLITKEGMICVVDLCKDNGMFHKNEIDFHGHNGFEVTEIENVFMKNGFKIIKSEVFYKGLKRIDEKEHPYELFITRMKKI